MLTHHRIMIYLIFILIHGLVNEMELVDIPGESDSETKWFKTHPFCSKDQKIHLRLPKEDRPHYGL